MSGGLAILWNPKKVDVDVIVESDNWMAGLVRSFRGETKFTIINVYGPTQTREKKELWNNIDEHLVNIEYPHTIIGG